MIDIHSHIIPGVDDGAETLVDSVEIVRGLVAQGVTDIIATPHFVDGSVYESPREKNRELFAELLTALKEHEIKVNIYLGNEIYITERIDQLIKDGMISTLADSKYILVELPLNGEYTNYEDILESLGYFGYQVILAHPERYGIFQEDYSKLMNLCEMGILLQCNIGSVIGKYGKDVKKQVKRLMKEKRVFCFGSDMHHARGKNEIVQAMKKMRKYYNDSELERVLVRNPRNILKNS